MKNLFRAGVLVLMFSLSVSCEGESSFGGGGGGTKAKPAEDEDAESGDALPEQPDSEEAAEETAVAEVPPDDEVAPDETVTPTRAPADNPTVAALGSFTVWAEPPNPQRGEPYFLVIEVKLPSGTTGYAMNDLSGRLKGTDGFVQRIPGKSEFPGDRSFEVSDDLATLKILVPGALIRSTRDTVQISSTLLNESQTLTVQFQ
jgi:hypothetical protein